MQHPVIRNGGPVWPNSLASVAVVDDPERKRGRLNTSPSSTATAISAARKAAIDNHSDLTDFHSVAISVAYPIHRVAPNSQLTRRTS